MSSVRDFGAAGDGLVDDTVAIQHAVEQGEGMLEFPRGDYRMTRAIEIDLDRHGRFGLHGCQGTGKLVMEGPGPALRLRGNHQGTADPDTMQDEIWKRQRMPTVSAIEIEGRHPEADGIELDGTMQSIVQNVGLHKLRHGLRLVQRNRNVVIAGCHIYHNSGAGIFLDGVNLHQINIVGNHISYNRIGGIRIERSAVRNLQITGNDIEYNTNRSHGLQDEPTAEIYIDTTAPGASVNEITIASNTLQARPSPQGANVRIVELPGSVDRPPGLFAITGNVIGSQTNNIHLTGCYGFSITGNCIYSAVQRNILLEDCRQIVLSSNQCRRHTPDAGTGILLRDSSHCIVNACHVLDEAEQGQASGLPLLELQRCSRITLTGCQVVGHRIPCWQAEDCHDVLVSGCSFFNDTEPPVPTTVAWLGAGSGNVMRGCHIRPAGDHAIQAASAAGLTRD